MKFCDMPYERIDFGKVKEELLGLMKAFEMAESAQNSLKSTKSIMPSLTGFPHRSPWHPSGTVWMTTDAFYEEEKAYYDEQVPAYSNLSVEYLKLLYHSRFREGAGADHRACSI